MSVVEPFVAMRSSSSSSSRVISIYIRDGSTICGAPFSVEHER